MTADHRHPGPILRRYVAREALLPTALALLGLTAVVLVENVLGLSDLLVNRGLGAGAVARVALGEAVPAAALVFPFAVLIGFLVALGRLATDGEVLALEASGIPAVRLGRGLLTAAAIATVAAGALSLEAGPRASRALDATLARIAAEQPWTRVRANAVNRFGGWLLEAREVSAAGDRLRGVLLWMPDLGETLFAASGRLDRTDAGAVELTLAGGSAVLSGRRGPRQVRFERLTATLPDPAARLARKEEDRLAGWSLSELARRARVPEPAEPSAASGRGLSRAALELHRRFALPAATPVFGLLALGLFLARGRGARASGAVAGLLLTLGYYGLVQVGEGLAQSGRLPLAAGVWLPNVVLLLAAAALLAVARGRAWPGDVRSAPRPVRAARGGGGPHRHALVRYVARRFASLAALAFAVLLGAYLVIDVMERLDWFARHGATGVEVLRFYGARTPLLASRILPMALLVGSALTVSLLAVDGELLGMRASGIPAWRAVAPVLALSFLVAPLAFALNDVVVPRTNALADFLKQTEIKERAYRELAERRTRSVWVRNGSQVLEAAFFDAERGVARDLTLYELGGDALPRSRADARAAHHIGGGRWRLDRPVRVELGDGAARRTAAPRYAQLGEALPAEVDTMHLSVSQLAREVSEVEADGYDATALRVDLHVKLAAPLACVVLPLTVLLFAVGGPPFPGPAKTLLVGIALGVGFVLATGVAASIGYGGGVPGALAGWGPLLLFAALAAALGVRAGRAR